MMQWSLLVSRPKEIGEIYNIAGMTQFLLNFLKKLIKLSKEKIIPKLDLID